jgi:hypothetical protein
MPKADFVPERDGFHFANEFVNVIAKVPGYGTLETGGRCGGMAYAALDYWFNGRLPIPADAALPHDGTLMADYIYKRQLETYLVPSAINFITWTLAGDGENFFHKGVTRWTKKASSRSCGDDRPGQPQVLGLVKVTDLREIGRTTRWSAGHEDDGKGTCARTVDNRYPDGRSADHHAKRRTDALGGERGLARWFIQGYGPSDRTLRTARSCRRRSAGITSWRAARSSRPQRTELAALGHNPRQVRQVGAGSLAYIADVPANGTLLKERSQDQVYVIDGEEARDPEHAGVDAHGSRRTTLTVPTAG